MLQSTIHWYMLGITLFVNLFLLSSYLFLYFIPSLELVVAVYKLNTSLIFSTGTLRHSATTWVVLHLSLTRQTRTTVRIYNLLGLTVRHVRLLVHVCWSRVEDRNYIDSCSRKIGTQYNSLQAHCEARMIPELNKTPRTGCVRVGNFSAVNYES